jgi:hypothetical protein
VENPSDGAGRGAIEALGPFQCGGAGCPASTLAKAEDLPWPVELSEPEAGLIREQVRGVAVRVRCAVAATPGERERVLSNQLFTGEWTPVNSIGTSAGKPAYDEFGAGSGELVGEAGAARTLGRLKLEGYEEQQVISAE